MTLTNKLVTQFGEVPCTLITKITRKCLGLVDDTTIKQHNEDNIDWILLLLCRKEEVLQFIIMGSLDLNSQPSMAHTTYNATVSEKYIDSMCNVLLPHWDSSTCQSWDHRDSIASNVPSDQQTPHPKETACHWPPLDSIHRTMHIWHAVSTYRQW